MPTYLNDRNDQLDDLEFEPCQEINESEDIAPRAGFNGLLKDAPVNASTSIVNGLSQQLIHQINLIVLRLSRPLLEGSDVRKLQEKLKAAGFAISVADGVFGSGTDKAVKEFQKQKGLVADGIVGPKTLEQFA